ncbi:MAG: pantothenate kinase, partial [Bacteroidales bacterium]|nr:pantothenate kinase [Bacteroidales bacterium]
GIREEVKGTIGIYENRYPGLRVVLTGGDMNYFDKYLKSNIFAVSNLVLVGLKDILRHNVENLR